MGHAKNGQVFRTRAACAVILVHRDCKVNLSNVCLGNFDTIPRELYDFARRQVVNALMYKGDERRRELRHPMVVPVHMVAVDDWNRPIGDIFQVVTRDVSNFGIGVIGFEEFTGDRYAIQLSLAQTDVCMAVALTWAGEMGPFYGAAGRYIEKLDQFPVDE